MRTMLPVLFLFALVAAACGKGASPAAGTPPGETTAVVTTAPASTAAPTTTAAATTVATATTVAPATTLPDGAISAACVNGWTTPEPGTDARTLPLDLIRRFLGLGEDDVFVVETMRHFTGPEDVGIIEPRREVERWYVEAHLRDDPSVSGRWIVRYVDEDINGVMAEAPEGTTGFEPGTWTSYEGETWTSDEGDEGERVEPTYDPFTPPCTAEHGPYCQCGWGVDGCSCDDEETPLCTGIPPTVMGCLSGL